MFFQLALHVLHRPNLVTKLKPISEEHKQKQELPLRRNPFPLTSNSNSNSHSQSLQISPHFSLSLPTTTTTTNASSMTMTVTTTVSSSSSSANKLLKVHHRSSASSFRFGTTTTTTEVSSEDVVVATAADRVRSEGFEFGFESEVKREVNQCFGCRRKVRLIGCRCRCGELFCAEHRYTNRHVCSYDYKVAGPNKSVLPWERDWEEDKVVEEEERAWTPKRRAKAPSLAKLTMEDEELRRLRRVGMYIRERISSSDMGLSLVVGFGT